MSDYSIQKLLARGLIEKVVAGPEEIVTLIGSAEKGLRNASQIIDSDPVRSVSQMYDALYSACCALMLGKDYRAAGPGNYRTVLIFCEAVLDKKYIDTLEAFEEAEKRRHNEMYDGCYSLTSREAVGLLTKARRFTAYIKTTLPVFK